MKSSAVDGTIASFFTYHEQSHISEWNELDIEILGRYNDQVQFNVISPNQADHVYSHQAAFDPSKEFHVYAMEWTPDYVAWSVDSTEVYRQTAEHIAEINLTQKIMMNLWASAYADWSGVLDAGALPAYAMYDWVKYYSFTPSAGQPFTLQWTDHFNSFDTGRWEKASHTWDSNQCDFTPANVTLQDGYMILSLTKKPATGYNGGTILETDITKPYLQELWFFGDKIQIRFSEKMEPVSAQTAANYVVTGVTVSSAELAGDGRTVWLQTAGRDSSLSYNLLPINLKDRAGNTLNIAVFPIKETSPQTGYFNFGGEALYGVKTDQVYDPMLAYGREGGSPENTPFNHADARIKQILSSEVRGIHTFKTRIMNGSYRLVLYFRENEYSITGSRVFDVLANGQLVADNLDILNSVAAGEPFFFELDGVEVENNLLDIRLIGVQGEPVCSGLSLHPVPSGLSQLPELPGEYLFRVYPNPFNNEATVTFQMPLAGDLALDIFNQAGQRIDRQKVTRVPAGEIKLRVNGSVWASGVYYARMMVDGQPAQYFRLVLIK